MKIIRFVLAMWVLLGMVSCIKDNTGNGTGAISEIYIEEGSIRELYDIDRGEVLTITPRFEQSHRQKPLSYTWEIDQKVYSTDPEFVYTGNRLGSYKCRLIVENEDGKTFFPFRLNVNSSYEEGITVLSNDAQGKSMLSFMLKQRKPGVEDHFETGDCFEGNNPDFIFASNASDMVQSDGNLIIACQGNPADGSVPTVYYLDEKTFVVQNEIKVKDNPSFKPIKLGVPRNGYAGVLYPVLCENGSMYELSVSEGEIIPSSRLNSRYAGICEVISGVAAGRCSIYFWDKERGNLCMLTDGYGPYFCSKTYLLTAQDHTPDNNYFRGLDFVGMFTPRLPQNAAATETSNIVVITKNGALFQKVILRDKFWSNSPDAGTNVLVDNGGKKMCGVSQTKFTEQSPCVATQLYYRLFFAEKNKIYAWDYTGSLRLEQVPEYCSLGTADAVVTCMELSQDHQELFVAFYEPNESGLNGHVWVYDTQEGRLLRKYDNVCYRPVKIFYKKK